MACPLRRWQGTGHSLLFRGTPTCPCHDWLASGWASPPGVFCKSVIMQALKVLCFHTLVQVFILNELRRRSVWQLVTLPPGQMLRRQGRSYEAEGRATNEIKYGFGTDGVRGAGRRGQETDSPIFSGVT